MPKLLQINSVVNTGSTGRIAEQLGELAISYGWDSYIAYGREAHNSKSKLIKIGSKFSVYVHAIFSKYFDNHGLMSKLATKRFLKIVDRIKPDIVHLHNIHGYYINYPLLFDYLQKHNIQTIITIHDFWLMTGHCAYINKSCNKWKSGCERCPRLSQYPEAKIDCSKRNWIIKKRIFSNMTNLTLVPVSYWLSKYVNESLLKNIKQNIIYNGIDLNVFQPYSEKCTTIKHVNWDKFTIMCIATKWTEANGFNDIMKLSSLLPEYCQILMVGLNAKQLIKLPQNIIGLKKTENFLQLQELYTKSDIVFNPNREVTFGLVTVEAMACGTPAVVLSDTAGEELVDKLTGYIIDKVEDLIDLIPKIQQNNKEKIQKNCIERVKKYFNSEKQLQQYIDLYNKLLNK